MEIRPIKTKADYRAALGEIETLMRAETDTPEGERLDVLVTLVEAYERKHNDLAFAQTAWHTGRLSYSATG